MQTKPLAAEFFGSFLIVASLGGSLLLVSSEAVSQFAAGGCVGLAVLAASYSAGPVSGGHFNPAVTVGLLAAGRFDTAHAAGYIVAQLLGGVAAVGAVAMLSWSVGGIGDNERTVASLANAYGGRDGIPLEAAAAVEALMSAIFLVVFVGATANRESTGFAALVIGATFGLLTAIALPLTNAGLNPARATAAAIFAGPQ
ncbi:MAG TPA: aquaporin, partial [Hyphomicrobiaceae bacterium]|nr:aquaporin [Hyphomicrobiaceae bacterium]